MRTPLKILIFTTIGLSLAALFIPQILLHLSLSWMGLKHFYLWQLLTNVLVEPGPFSFNFVFQLGFNMYILYMFGTSLLERMHPAKFFALYFGAVLASSLIALPFPNVWLAGSTNAVYAVLVAWMILNPGSQLLLFFAVPFKAQWLILGLIAFSLFLNLVASQWVQAAALAAATLYAYLFTLFAFRVRRKEKKPYQHSKIYDIKSGTPLLDDDAFMDAMLEKISRLGENSLSAQEKKRMKEISEKK